MGAELYPLDVERPVEPLLAALGRARETWVYFSITYFSSEYVIAAAGRYNDGLSAEYQRAPRTTWPASFGCQVSLRSAVLY
jgi:hypothetical protein